MKFTSHDIEILIATMNRSNLDFLKSMFPHHQAGELRILIINQTSNNVLLNTANKNIRVINSFEKGLSKSRNLALQHANAKLVVIADDDLVYQTGFETSILNAYNENPSATLISFQLMNENLKLHKNYSLKKIDLRKNTKHHNLSSAEITLQMKYVYEYNLYFDTDFGLGASFNSGEETLFLQSILKNNLIAFFIPKTIAFHPGKSSGSNQSNALFIQAKTAVKYKKYGSFTYLWLVKFILFLVRTNRLPINRFFWAFKTGVKAIQKYNKLKNKDE
ncbi:MAG: glycosyltransferase family 2 protein [Bacteroidota bacterium]